MEIQVNNYNIQQLTKDDISSYIQSVFSSDFYLNVIKGFDSRKSALIFIEILAK